MSRLKQGAQNALLVILSLALCFGALEVFLRLRTYIHPPPQTRAVLPPAALSHAGIELPDPPADLIALNASRNALLTMPDEWKRRPATVPGAAHAEYWHGVLHVYDANGFRFSGPIPLKRDGIYRVMVVGDSSTYGYAIEERFRFSSLVEQWLGRDFNIEFVNLGAAGQQSEDILAAIRKFRPVLKPDLVLYIASPNDFLPSGVGQYSYAGYDFPLPDAVKKYLIKHTLAGAFINELYDDTLRTLRLRTNFYDDILKDFAGYQVRFRRDVASMNREVTAAGLPPLVAMVIDQYPTYGGRGHQIARAAERHLTDAGAKVIPIEDYYRKYSRRPMKVSKWEGHPDEVAHWIWAQMIETEIRGRKDLGPFAKSSGDNSR